MAKSKSITDELFKYCTPLQIYIVLAFVSMLTLILNEYNLLGQASQKSNDTEKQRKGNYAILKLMVIRIIYYSLFGLILYQLCSHSKLGRDVAWLIILFPFLNELLSMFTSSLTTVIHGPSPSKGVDNCAEVRRCIASQKGGVNLSASRYY